jgi:hypothetical protein
MSVDVRMDSENVGSTFPAWDFFIDSEGQAPFLEGDVADDQAANLCAFVDKNSSPQLTEQHTPWTQYMLGETDFGMVDMTIRNNLNLLSLPHRPTYDIVNDKLTCTVVR